MLTTMLAQFSETGSPDSFWMPVRAAEGAGLVDWLFYFLLGISAFFFVLIFVLMVFFVIRYRRRPGVQQRDSPTHSTALELVWTTIPAVLLLITFYVGFKGFMEMNSPYADAKTINVIGRKWIWTFEYPESGLMIDNELHVPVDTPIQLVVTSEDVIHSIFIPAFRLKRDAVPGRYNKMYFLPTEPGEYDLFCAEYCGTAHSDMIGKVVVHPPGEYELWLEGALKDPLEDLTPEQFEQYRDDPDAFIAANPDLGLSVPLWKKGQQLYESKGCNQCHMVDGSANIGPAFNDIWGAQRTFVDGSSATVDENYIRSSILNPNEQVVAGYDAVMPTYKGRIKDREITAIIEYIRRLGDQDADTN